MDAQMCVNMTWGFNHWDAVSLSAVTSTGKANDYFLDITSFYFLADPLMRLASSQKWLLTVI